LSAGSLSKLQADFLRAWFTRSSEFFLTGGGALVGYLGAPRTTDDLDLFTDLPEAFEQVDRLVGEVCREVGATARGLRSTPEFRRYRIARADESSVLDLVLDRVPQLSPDKDLRDGVRLDSPTELLVNKLCALVSRSEPRDFVDVWFLCQQGLDREQALRDCARKDSGVGPDTLLWILRDLSWDQFTVPGVSQEVVGATADFFRAWAEELALGLYPRS
jgi:hypothetical protein